MPQSQYLAGTEFTVQVGSAQYPFKTVDLDLEAKDVDQSNSKYTPGFEASKAGQKKCTLDLEGPYVPGEVPLTLGGEYTWSYLPSAALTAFSFLGLILRIRHGNDREKGPRMAIWVKAQS